MKITTEEFIRRFHSVTGTTIGERRKSLFLLLNGIEQTESVELDFSCLHPNSPLEEKFKVDALIYFRRIPDLLEVLKSEKPILIKRILKVSWFLEEAFQNTTGEQLVSLVFPYISFRAKVKLVNKLSFQLKNSQQANAFFEAIEKKYGLYLASKILPACTTDLITNCIQHKKIKLTPRQLLIVIKKNPEVTESILDLINNSDDNIVLVTEYENVFQYLVHDIGWFFKLYNKYLYPSRLGWRNTDKFIQKNRQDVIKNPHRYYGLLHNKQIAKSLNQDFKDLYFNMFPKSVDHLQSHHDVFNILERLPKKMRNINFILTMFERVYGGQLWDYPKVINLKLLEMLPPDKRDALITPENKSNYYLSDEEWQCYMKTEKSIPYLKKTISLTSDMRTRIKLVRLLIKPCKINRDKDALANMCKYMLTKHRNDNVAVRQAFLGALKNNFRLQDLEEQHWSLIHELIELFTLNNEDFGDSSDFLKGYIHFRLKHKLPLKEQLTEWLKTYGYDMNIFTEEPRFEKQCLLTFGELISEMFGKEKQDKEKEEEGGKSGQEKDEETDLDKLNIAYVQALISWNKRHPQEKSSLFSYSDVMYFIRRSNIKESNNVITDVIKHFLLSTNDLEERKNLLNLYLSRCASYLDLKIIKWSTQHEPLTIINHIDVVIRFALDSRYYRRAQIDFLWKWWRNFTHLENYQRVVNICLSEFEETIKTSGGTASNNAVKGLSYLMDGEEFKKFIVPYYPSGMRANAKTKENVTLYNIQQSIGPCLRNLKPPSLAMESILIFCKGDYLKLIRESLYSVCGNINEDKLPSFFNELAGRAVSVRKHAMHLAFRVLYKEQIYDMLKRFMETEKNPSVRKFLVKGVFNFFVINADDYSWKLVKENINAVDVNDQEALEILMQIEKIPAQYTVQYIIFTWNIISNLPHPYPHYMESDKSKLLRSVTSNIIRLFPKEFCNPIIQKYFFKSDERNLTQLQSVVHTFTCRYIIYCDSRTEQEERLKTNFEVVKNFVSATWYKRNIIKQARNYVANFLNAFCEEYVTYNCHDKEILIKFADLWNSLFKSHQAFDEYLHLQFTLIYVEKLPLAQIAQKLAKLCDSLADFYGFPVVSMFCKKLNSCSRYFISGEGKVFIENWNIFIENLIQSESSIFNSVLVILLLNEHKWIVTETNHKKIVELLRKHPDPAVQLYLESFQMLVID